MSVKSAGRHVGDDHAAALDKGGDGGGFFGGNGKGTGQHEDFVLFGNSLFSKLFVRDELAVVFQIFKELYP